jgi:hypothetical protein
VTKEFATPSTSQASAVLFALDANGKGTDPIFHDEADAIVRLCLKLSWTSHPQQPAQLADTTCPADLQPSRVGR